MESIIKQGTLKKILPIDKGLSGLLEKFDAHKWFVFLVRGGLPYLEYYNSQTDAFTDKPTASFDLRTCQKVCFTYVRYAKSHSFSIELENVILELASPSRELIISWCDCIESSLESLGFYTKEADDHVYSFCPAVVNSRFTVNEAVLEEEAGAVGGVSSAAVGGVSLKAVDSVSSDAIGNVTYDEDILSTLEEMDTLVDVMRQQDIQSTLNRKISLPMDDNSSDYSGDFVDKDFFLRQHLINKVKEPQSSVGRSVVKPERLSVHTLFKNQSDTTDDSDVDNEHLNIPMHNMLTGAGNLHTSQEKLAVKIPGITTSNVEAVRTHEADCKAEMVNIPEAVCSGEAVNKTGTENIPGAACQEEELYSDMCSCEADNNVSSHIENEYTALPQNSLFSLADTPTLIYDEALLTTVDNDLELIPVKRPIPKKRTMVIQSAAILNWETFDNNVTESNPNPALLLKDSSSFIPPLPPRVDSLPARGNNSVDAVQKLFQDRPLPRVPSPDFSIEVDRDRPAPIVPRRSFRENTECAPPRRPSRRPQSTSGIPPPLPIKNTPCLRTKKQTYTINNEGEVIHNNDLIRRPERQLSLRMRLDPSAGALNVISLKHNQIDILQGEKLSSGVSINITQKSCLGVALVDIDQQVWIAGWNWMDYPRLHNKFHVGDQLLSINSQPVQTAGSAMKTLKHAVGPVELVVQRIPHGLILEIRRSAEGESVGIKREGGTGEIVYVDPNGLAAKSGLVSRAQPVLDTGMTSHWYITEINSRPVSLFFKDKEIEYRLLAVGLEISIVVQPADFIFEMKRLLHKKIKNYKNYLPK